jgi:hypothetical protein
LAARDVQSLVILGDPTAIFREFGRNDENA